MVEQWIAQWGSLAVVALTFLDESILPIITSTLVLASAGFFLVGAEPISANSLLKLLLVVSLPAALGAAFGVLPIFALTYFQGRHAIERWGKYVRVQWHDVEKLQKRMEGSKWDEVLLVVLRAMPLVPGVALSAFAGLVRMPLAKYLALTFFGMAIRASILGFIGWQLGSAYEQGLTQLHSFQLVVLGIIAVALTAGGAWWYSNHLRSR